MNKLTSSIIILLIIVVSGLIGYFLHNPPQSLSFKSLSPNEQHSKIIEQRDYAINQAVLAGDYRCCINPPCTMCYTEGNKWNYGKAGTCACDEFIARGEDPCPQCVKGLIKDTGTSCEISSEKCDQ